jgi:hypothetical protein
LIILKGAQSAPFLYAYLLQLLERRGRGDRWRHQCYPAPLFDCPHSLQARGAHNRPAVDTLHTGTTCPECADHAVEFSQFKPHHPMALFSQASDLQTTLEDGTHPIIWVGTSISADNGQANSHTRAWKSDGLPAAKLAVLHTTDKVKPCPVSGWRSKNWG